ncbi:hypothetical protein Fmac_010469 [Flemingia macrophylla]|uniref:Uncharacterized protein n=1 Tax=Flemingia macrophylla TaxID=520843 RepID=A0ABD1MJQ3_9FABA
MAALPSPTTDGINPDSSRNTRIEDCYIISGDDCVNDHNSSRNTRIEDCYIISGDDCVAVKSGWDKYA